MRGEANSNVVCRMGGRGRDAWVSHSLVHTEWSGRGWVEEMGRCGERGWEGRESGKRET